MSRMPVPITGSSQKYLETQLSPERTINMYEVVVPGQKENGLIMIPGSKVRYTNVSGETTRNLYVDADSNLLYAIYENSVVEHDGDLDATSIGTLETTSGYVGIKGNNSKQITFVDNTKGYVWDYSGVPSFDEITSPGFPTNPVDVDFLDGHMLVAQSTTNRWYASDIDNAASYDALNFASLTSDAEKLIGLRVVNRRIFIFGQFITEVFYNSGNASSFPFVRDNNVVIQFGSASVKSIAQDENMLFWVATRKDGAPSVQVTTGGNPKRVSNPAVEYSLQQFTNLADTCGFLFNTDGYTFYLITNPTDNKSWLLNYTLGTWSELQMIDGSAYFACSHAFFNKKHYFGHHNAPKLSEFSSEFVKNEDENIHCLRITAPVRHPSLQDLRINRLEIQGKQGSGAVTTQLVNRVYRNFEENPLLYLSVSADSGETYGNPESQSLGRVGQYDWKTVWTRFGRSDVFVLKLETFHAARTMLLRASADIELLGYSS